MKNNGFTLIEAMIALAVGAFILAIFLPAIQGDKPFRDKMVVCRTDDNTVIREFEYDRFVYIVEDQAVYFGRGRGSYHIPDGVSCIVESKKFK